ncbi:MAG: RagB/SusD family nutrient uptake outer membrane protein [Bacteroidota bacterium]
MKKLILIIVISFTVLACDDFLNVEPRDVLGIDQVFRNENDFYVALNGAYNNMLTSGYYGGQFMTIADASSDNGIIPIDAETVRNPHFYDLLLNPINSSLLFWDTGYETIASANNVLAALGSVSMSEQSANRIRGEALFIRALVHFDLSRVFGQDYNFTSDHSNLSTIIVTQTEIAEPPRNTVGEVYAFVMEDLNEAISLLSDNSRPQNIDERFIATANAAIALRARVYLYRSDFSAALADATQIIDGGNYELAPYIINGANGNPDLSQIDSWSSRTPTSESILEGEADELDGGYPGINGLAGLYQKGAGNAVFGPSLDIINLYAADDVRRNWYVQDAGVWHVNKYPGQGGLPLQFTAPMIRLTELYLIAAECNARLGNEAAALNAINLIRVRANQPEFTSSGSQLLNDILEERRRELAFEGHRLFDLKRMQQDLVRNDCNLSENCVVTYGDRLFAYPIPQEEIDGNNNIVQEGY